MTLRLRVTLAVAAALHVAAISLALGAVRHQGNAAPQQASIAGEIDIVQDAPIDVPASDDRSAGSPRAPAVVAFKEVRRASELEEAQTVAKESPAAASDGEGWSFSVVARKQDDAHSFGEPRALGEAMQDGVRRVVAESARPANDARASLRAALNEHDRAIGMSAGAPLVPLTRDTVRASRAPTTGRARFEFRTDEAGVVASVRVIEASADRATWNEVAEALAREARARTLALPKGSHGIAVTIDVASSVKTASGIDRGETSVSVASPAATGFAASSHAEQPLRFNLVVGPNQIDATMHLGLGDALHDATTADRRVVSAQIVDERTL